MFWADRIAHDLKVKGPQRVDDMKTPSGRIHVGSLRGVIIHDVVFRALRDTGISASYTYIFDDHDPMDSLPAALLEKFKKYLGVPLYRIPSPEPGFDSFAQFYAEEFRAVFEKLGAKPEIFWSSKLYQRGLMDEGIRVCLDEAAKIRKIYKQVSGADLSSDWFPFNVICEHCGKVGTTKVYKWDGKKVYYRCLPNLVTWAQGCGQEGSISPFGAAGKLPWKVEWAVKWQVLGVTIEGAGKDHMSAGGSHDIAARICEEVLNYKTPYPIPYEFFLIGGKKMSSSRGLGSTAREVSEILPPYILRFLMVRTPSTRAIDFDPGSWTIPDLFDEYDRSAQIWWEKATDDMGRIFELSQPDGKAPGKMFLPRFRDVAMVAQMPNLDPIKYFTRLKGSKLTASEKKILDERIKYAEIWLDGYAPAEAVFSLAQKLPEEVKKLSTKQKDYLGKLAQVLGEVKTPENFEKKMYDFAKELKLPSKDAFGAVYISLLGKPFGPKAAWLILSLGQDKAKKRFLEVSR